MHVTKLLLILKAPSASRIWLVSFFVATAVILCKHVRIIQQKLRPQTKIFCLDVQTHTTFIKQETALPRLTEQKDGRPPGTNLGLGRLGSCLGR